MASGGGRRSVKGKLIGYAREWRGSTRLRTQVRRLRRERCWNVYAGEANQLELALMDVRPGDTLVVPSLMCLYPRNKLKSVLEALQRDDVGFAALDEDLDSRRADGEMVIPALLRGLGIMSALQSSAIREGLAEARTSGRPGGRPRALSEAERQRAEELAGVPGYTMKRLAAELGVARGTLYNAGLRAKGKPPREGAA